MYKKPNQLVQWQEPKPISRQLAAQGVRKMFADGKAGEKQFNQFALTLGRIVMSSKNDFLRSKADPATVVEVAADAARMGLQVDGKEACVVSFKGKAAMIVMVDGLLRLAYRNPDILRIHTEIVYANDEFSYNPVEGELRHSIDYDLSTEERGQIRLVYALADVMRGGHKARIIEVVSKADVDKAMACSPSASSDHTPWKTHYNEMAKKTAIKRLFKYLPVAIEESQYDEDVLMYADEPKEREINPTPTVDTNALLQSAPAPQQRQQPAPQPQPAPVYEQPIQRSQPAPVYEQPAPVQRQPVQQAQPVHSDDDWDDASHLDANPFAGETV